MTPRKISLATIENPEDVKEASAKGNTELKKGTTAIFS